MRSGERRVRSGGRATRGKRDDEEMASRIEGRLRGESEEWVESEVQIEEARLRHVREREKWRRQLQASESGGVYDVSWVESEEKIKVVGWVSGERTMLCGRKPSGGRLECRVR